MGLTFATAMRRASTIASSSKSLRPLRLGTLRASTTTCQPMVSRFQDRWLSCFPESFSGTAARRSRPAAAPRRSTVKDTAGAHSEPLGG